MTCTNTCGLIAAGVFVTNCTLARFIGVHTKNTEKENNMDEFEIIYRQYFSMVFSHARRLTGDDYLAEELTEETFFKALKALKRYDDKQELKAWLCTIAKNTWISNCRKKEVFSLWMFGELPFARIAVLCKL